jgi:hypothetical protein
MTTSEERALHLANENREQWKLELTIDKIIDRTAVAAFNAGCEHGKCVLREIVKKTFNPDKGENWP